MESLPKIKLVESGRGERIKGTCTGERPYDRTALEQYERERALRHSEYEQHILAEEKAKLELLAAQPVVRGVAEIRWSVSQIIERMETARPITDARQRQNFRLALRHLEDAHHRLTLALE